MPDSAKRTAAERKAAPPRIAYTIDGAVEALGGAVSRSAIYDDIRDGKLKAHKRGRRTIITDENLRAYVAALPEMEGAAA